MIHGLAIEYDKHHLYKTLWLTGHISQRCLIIKNTVSHCVLTSHRSWRRGSLMTSNGIPTWNHPFAFPLTTSSSKLLHCSPEFHITWMMFWLCDTGSHLTASSYDCTPTWPGGSSSKSEVSVRSRFLNSLIMCWQQMLMVWGKHIMHLSTGLNSMLHKPRRILSSSMKVLLFEALSRIQCLTWNIVFRSW